MTGKISRKLLTKTGGLFTRVVCGLLKGGPGWACGPQPPFGHDNSVNNRVPPPPNPDVPENHPDTTRTPEKPLFFELTPGPFDRECHQCCGVDLNVPAAVFCPFPALLGRLFRAGKDFFGKFFTAPMPREWEVARG